MPLSPLAFHPQLIDESTIRPLPEMSLERKPKVSISKKSSSDSSGSRSWQSILLSPSPSPEKDGPCRESIVSRKESQDGHVETTEPVNDRAISPQGAFYCPIHPFANLAEREPFTPAGRLPYDTIVRRGSLPLFFRETPRLPPLETNHGHSTPLRQVSDGPFEHLSSRPGSPLRHVETNDPSQPSKSRGSPLRLTTSPPYPQSAYPKNPTSTTSSDYYSTPVLVSKRQQPPRWNSDHQHALSAVTRRLTPNFPKHLPSHDGPFGYDSGNVPLEPLASHLQSFQQPFPPAGARAGYPPIPAYMQGPISGLVRPRLFAHPYAAPGLDRELQRYHNASGFETRPSINELVKLSPSSAISPGGQKAPRKRGRFGGSTYEFLVTDKITADDSQLAILNEVFERTSYPSTEEREDLARRLGMTSRSVQIWFQNRRRAIKVEAISAMQRAEAEARKNDPPVRGFVPAPPPYIHNMNGAPLPIGAKVPSKIGGIVKTEPLSPHLVDRAS